MSASYYREPTNFFPSVHPSSDTSQSDEHPQADDAPQGSAPSQPVGPPRYCTVKGCTVILLSDYLHKMCEVCRGRHRIYAMTKRAKRKMEKAALGSHDGQPVVWMPPDDAVEVEGTGQEASQPEDAQPLTDTADTYRFPANAWDPSAIDPSLFSQESALAGALTLPGSSRAPAGSKSQDSPPDLDASPDSATIPLISTTNFQTGMQLPLSSLSPAIFDRPSDGQDESAPPRLCSIKGCKARVSGNSYFKMCEPCRDRYRNYGITKRAKWKQEKQVAVAELQQKVHGNEDERRVDVSLPPLSPKSTDPEWHEWQVDGTTRVQTPQDGGGNAGPSASRPARMCTVSHCREILPPDYQFLRCDRHRLQNRHHSKLKRVRDKEVKAAAFNHWYVSVGGHAGDDASPGPAHDSGPDSEGEHGASYDNEGTPGTGFPPAARGMRRTNHVCIIKACFNLLSPTNPWRMCDVCRAKDRAHRRDKALRASGVVTSPPPGGQQRFNDAADGADKEQGGPPKRKKKKKKKPVNTAVVSPDIVDSAPASLSAPQVPSTSAAQGDPQGAALVFMTPLLPSKSPSPAVVEALSPSDVPVEPSPPITVPAAEGTPSFASPHPAPVSSTRPFQIVSAEEIASKAAHAESAAAAPKKKRKVRKDTAPVRVGAVASSSTAVSMVPPPMHAPFPASHDVPPPPPFPVDGPAPGAPYPPYYMPPYGMQPYGGQAPPYPYSHYGPHYQYPPPPYGYQPPYPPYPQPYPYPPPPYGQQPYGPPPYPASGPPPPPPPQAPPPVQGTYSVSVSADFVSRADYAAASQNIQQQGVTPHGGPQGTAPHYATFSAKTGEPHNRVSSVPSVLRRKRPLEGEGMFFAGEQPASRSSSSAERSVPPPAPAPPDPVAPGDTVGAEVIAGPLSDSSATAAHAMCSNQKCCRPLPAEHNGSLCARCKERLRKRSEKAKQRFKLEPRKLVGKAVVVTAHEEPDASGSMDMYPAEVQSVSV